MISFIKNSWFYRQIFTYLPIFMIVSFVLICLIFLSISQITRKEAIKANGQYLQHAIQSVEYALESIDQLMIKEILMNTNAQHFVKKSKQENLVLIDYYLSNNLRDLTLINPLIDSVYFYRESDQVILSTRQKVSIDNFGDREFLLSIGKDIKHYYWSSLRSYREFGNQQEPVYVISLVRSAFSGEGYMVVNIKGSSIGSFMEKTSSSQISFVDIIDQNGNLLWGNPNIQNGLQWKTKGTELFRVKSDYTGWIYRSGLKDANLFGIASSVISYVWIAGGLLVAILGALLIIYVTHRNYKPIETMLARIHAYSIQRNRGIGFKAGHDEFKFIGAALENLMKESSEFLKQREENLIYRKMFFFRQLMSEECEIGLKEWNSEAEKLELCGKFDQLNVAVIEIDNYFEFSSKYSNKDQYLLKFVLSNVILEIAENQSINIWSEWLAKQQLSILFQITGSERNVQEIIFELCEKMRMWVEINLKFTITIGIGTPVSQISLISQSYQESLEGINFKTALGSNRVIGCWEVWAKERGEDFRHLHYIRSLSQYFRLGEQEWKIQYIQFMDEMKKGFFSRDEIITQLNYMIYYLYKEIMELPVEFQDVWKDKALPQLNKLVDQFDMIEGIEAGIFETLAQAAEQMNRMHESRNNHLLMHEVKKYIEEHFSNQDLSLSRLSDEFGLSARYLSKLFKDEFGVKFVDYLIAIRMKKAKKMLVETSNSVQEIAMKAGYAHSLSFIRVFKKMVGLTPGHYRKAVMDQK